MKYSLVLVNNYKLIFISKTLFFQVVICLMLAIIGGTQLSYSATDNGSGQTLTTTVQNNNNSFSKNTTVANANISTRVTFPQQAHVNIVLGAALKRDKAFQPDTIGIAKNGTVTWINDDTVTHTVTSGSGINDPNIGKKFDSGMLGKNFSFMFSTPGTYNYFCQVHPTMVGKVIVR
jgi:plastocyanin